MLVYRKYKYLCELYFGILNKYIKSRIHLFYKDVN